MVLVNVPENTRREDLAGLYTAVDRFVHTPRSYLMIPRTYRFHIMPFGDPACDFCSTGWMDLEHECRSCGAPRRWTIIIAPDNHILKDGELVPLQGAGGA